MKKPTLSFFAKLALASVLFSAPLARAHSVWIEDTSENQLVIRFGESGEPFEKSPGLLDQLFPPHAWKSDTEDKASLLGVEKKSDHFLLLGASSADATFGESGWPVYRSEKLPGGAKTAYYLRWVPRAQHAIAAKPAHVLDLVPTQEANVFTLIFRGQPLANHRITFQPAGEKETELTTDDSGRVRIPKGKPGVHVISANHRDTTAGGFAFGQSYERTSHTITTAWRQS